MATGQRAFKLEHECPGCGRTVWVLPIARLGRLAMFEPATMPTADVAAFGYVWRRGAGMLDVDLLPDRLHPARCHIRHHCANPGVERWLSYRMRTEAPGGWGKYSNLLNAVLPRGIQKQLEALLDTEDSPNDPDTVPT